MPVATEEQHRLLTFHIVALDAGLHARPAGTGTRDIDEHLALLRPAHLAESLAHVQEP